MLAANGVLTHSFSSNGELYFPVHEVTNVQLVFNGTTPDLVGNGVFSLVLTDTNGDVYSDGVDYAEFNQASGTNDYCYIERTTNSSIPDGGTVLVSFNYYGVGSAPVGLDLYA